MQLSFTTLALALVSVVAGRDLSVVRKDSNVVVVKSKSGGDTLWFTLSLTEGVPHFEIKGNQKDDEGAALARVHLALEKLADKDAKSGLCLTGAAGHWSPIVVNQTGGDKKPRQIVLQSTMVQPDQSDIAGDAFTIVLRAVIDENAESFTIRSMIQNYPYSMGDGKGILTFDQVIGASAKVDSSAGPNGEITLGPYGSLRVITDSAIEDGEPGVLRAPRLEDCKGSRPKSIAEAQTAKHAIIEFGTIRPKNATFVEELTFRPQALSLPIPKEEQDDSAVKAQSKNNAPSQSAISVATGAAALLLGLGLLLA